MLQDNLSLNFGTLVYFVCTHDMGQVRFVVSVVGDDTTFVSIETDRVITYLSV